MNTQQSNIDSTLNTELESVENILNKGLSDSVNELRDHFSTIIESGVYNSGEAAPPELIEYSKLMVLNADLFLDANVFKKEFEAVTSTNVVDTINRNGFVVSIQTIRGFLRRKGINGVKFKETIKLIQDCKNVNVKRTCITIINLISLLVMNHKSPISLAVMYRMYMNAISVSVKTSTPLALPHLLMSIPYGSITDIVEVTG